MKEKMFTGAHVYTLLAVSLAMVILVIPTSVQAQTMVTLFELDNGARPLGMGGAFTALADDENALFYNPAGLASLGGEIRVNSFYERYLGLTDFGRLAIAKRGMGLGVLIFSACPLTQRDEEGNELDTFNYTTIGLVGAYGAKLGELIPVPPPWDRLALGARLKFYRVKTLEPGNGATLALDPALMFDFGKVMLGGMGLEALRLGLVIENLPGLPMKYGSGHRESWPLGFRLGGSLAIRGLIAAADLESNGTFHLGAEYQMAGLTISGFEGGELALRGGLVLGRRAALNMGLGFKLKSFQIDYAFSTHPQLPLSHILSFTVAFNLDDPS
ncbi:MAG: hypothetical protein ACE5LD_00090 [Candidatus Bipolaricaulia bacterium]